MKISIIAKPNRKEEKIEKTDENEFKVFVKAPAKKGKANERILEVLAEYFGISKSQIKIISGLKSKNKIIEIT
jgi:uncharacterized protein (TIGR00251 family)